MGWARVAAGILVASAYSTGSAETPLTVDDLMQAEELTENVSFSPDGHRILFWRSAPLGRQSLPGLVNTNLRAERLFVADQNGGHVREVVAPKGTSYSRLGGCPWAPDSSGALLHVVSGGVYKIAHWAADTGVVTILPGRPSWSWEPFAWVGSQLIYATAEEGSQQRDSSEVLISSVQQKWSAKGDRVAQVTVSSANPVFETTRPVAGTLASIDFNTNAAIGGKATRTIASGDYTAIVASPNGKWLAAVRLAENVPDAMSSLSRGRRGELQLFAVEGDEIRLVRSVDDLDVEGAPNNSTGAPSLVWSREGDRLLVGGKRADQPRSAARLYEIDAKLGSRREMPPDDLIFVDPRLASGARFFGIGWIDDAPAVIGGRAIGAVIEAPKVAGRTGRDYGEMRAMKRDLYIWRNERWENLTGFANSSIDKFIAMPRRHSAMIIADGGLWQLRPGRAPLRLSASDLGKVVDFAADPSDPPLPPAFAYFSSDQVERVALLTETSLAPRRTVLDLTTRRAATGAGSKGSLEATSRDLLTTVSTVSNGWSSSYVVSGDGKQSIFAVVNSQMNKIALSPVTRFDYIANRQQLIGWVVTPSIGARHGPLPAIVSVYGGRMYGAETPIQLTTSVEPPVFNAQLLASQGYAVIYPSLPIDSGATTDIMTTLADEVLAAVDTLAGKGLVDPQRVGIIGQSFGGYCVAAILARRSDRFKAGVALAGIYDYVYTYGNVSLAQTLTDDGRAYMENVTAPEVAYVRFGEPFWRNLAAYVRNSPIFQVDNFNTPLLMLHGDLDIAATGLPGAERMYHALLRAGKKPVLIRYWGEGHVARSEPDMRDQWDRVTQWFSNYLK